MSVLFQAAAPAIEPVKVLLRHLVQKQIIRVLTDEQDNLLLDEREQELKD